MNHLIVEEIFNAPIEIVWKAITDKDQMKKWYFDLEEFKAEVGFEFQFEGTGRTGAKYTHLCKITAVIPYKKLQYSWEYLEVEGYTLVTFELFEEENKTRLKLTHSGTESFPKDNPDFGSGSFKDGWEIIMNTFLRKHLALSTNNFAKAEMMIRKPVAQVFAAFINPETTTKFWFTKSSGKLETGKQVTWTWEMYNLTVPVWVGTIIPNEKIEIEWGEGLQKSAAEWEFKALGADKTFVSVINYDFQATGDNLINQVRDSTGGFTMVLAGLKAYLEHGILLHLVRDKFPKELW